MVGKSRDGIGVGKDREDVYGREWTGTGFRRRM
jgi:hypothetical protein